MTTVDHLLRRHAPIPEEGWAEIDDEARERLTPLLAARRLVDFGGAHGWTWSGTDLGRVDDLASGPEGPTSGDPRARLRRRRMLSAVEVRVPFHVRRTEIDDLARGAADVDFDDLDRAAQTAAEIENRAVFHGWPDAGFTGIVDASGHDPLTLADDPTTYPSTVASAVDRLRCAGVAGPYALAIGPPGYTTIVETTEHGGYPLFEHLRHILDGPVVWTPGLAGAVVVSQRGGDFLLEVGQDLAVGYSHHDADEIHLYLQESFTFRSVEPDAALALTR